MAAYAAIMDEGVLDEITLSGEGDAMGGSWSPAVPPDTMIKNSAWLQLFGRIGALTSVYSFTADDEDASIPDLDIATRLVQGFKLHAIEMLDGVTAPTGASTLVVKSDFGATLISVTWSAGIGYLEYPLPIVSDLTISISGNEVNSATGSIRLIVAP